MYPEITITKLAAVIVGLVVLCCIADFPYWRRRRKHRQWNKQWEADDSSLSRVNEKLRAGTPLHAIEDGLDEEEN